MNFKASVITGPGHHSKYIIKALKKSNNLNQVIHTFPTLAVESHMVNNVETYQPKLYQLLSQSVWRIWSRLPFLQKRQSAQEVIYNLSDSAVSRYLIQSDILVGFSFVSLLSFKKAKSDGTLTVLEYSMAYIDFWMKILKEENKKWGVKSEKCSGMFSIKTIKKLQEECRTADYISVLSSFAKQTFLDAGFDEKKIIQMPLGISIEKFSPSPKNSSGQNKLFRFLFVGRLELLKGIPYLLQAFTEMNLPNTELQLVGQVLPEMQPILDKFASENIKVIGEVKWDKLVNYYQNADLLVFPSINDSFGLVVLEAMACGLPVVTTFNSCGTDVIEDGKEGFVIPIRNVEALKDKMQFCYENRELCNEMGISAREKVEKNFALEHYTDRVVSEYNRIIENKRNGDKRK